MAKDARLELRVDAGLKARVDARAGELGQKTTTFVERALEKALGDSSTAELPRSASGANSTVAGSTPAPPAPPRASKDYDARDHATYGRAQPKAFMGSRPKGGK